MEFLRHMTRGPYALAWVFVLAAAILLPGLDASGLWEPQERQLADRVAPRPELAKKQQQAVPQVEPAPPKDGCYRIPPKDALARTLTNRAMTWGRDHVSDSDAGRRLPLALLGLLTVLASAGIAMRLGSSRAGIVTTLVMLSMPLLVLQSRMLTSEIGTAAGGALILYGFVALGERRGALGIIESAVALASLAAGIVLGFLSGGALLGLLVPLTAYAFGVGRGYLLFRTIGNALYDIGLRAGRSMHMRWAIRDRQPFVADRSLAEQIKVVVAALAGAAVLGVLVYQLYSLSQPVPGLQPPQREVFGKAIVPTGCWSSALGAVWRPEDDLRYTFDSTFEQIAYGTFPWGILGPIAMFALMSSADRRRRTIGSITLVWAAGAWIACEAFQRKVGFTIWAGFPALAIAIGTWLDDVLGGREKKRNVMPAGAVLLGFFVAVAVFDLGKDLQSFTEKLTSLLIGGDQIAYPKISRLAAIPTRAWLLVLGGLVGVGFAVAMATWRDDAKRTYMRRAAQIGTAIALATTAVFGAFWAYGWEPALARHLSSKSMFDTYTELKKQGDQLVIMGDMGDAPYDYAPAARPEMVSSRDKVVEAIGRPNRVFAIAPQTELCQLHREIGGKPYFVLDDRNVRSLLLSNRVDGTTDKNPLRTTILHAEPKNIPSRPPKKPDGTQAHIVFENKIELLGWSIPKRVERGDKFQVTMFYKILQPVGANWKVLFHFDGPLRFNGDHDPINGRCQTSTWQPGDYIVDTHTVTAGGSAFAPGPYEVWTGFFTGAAPNWKNMTVSDAPPELRDTADRVKITTITLD
ncbi:MAG TPA: hypothetical protein VLB44_02565 [Kofleriaceae bacterium]|nr:hypothetical protein [Kofleriaceae bacterium]